LIIGTEHARCRDAQQNRQQIGGEAKALEQQVGQKGADETTPVMRIENSRRGVERAIVGVVGDQADGDQ